MMSLLSQTDHIEEIVGIVSPSSFWGFRNSKGENGSTYLVHCLFLGVDGARKNLKL